MPDLKSLAPQRPLRPDHLLPSIGKWSTLGGLILIMAIGASILLATVLKYSTSVKASGTVRPVGEVRLVQAGISGTAKDIAVQVNQPVRQGDVIVRLDSTGLEQQKRQLQISLQQSQVQIDQLNRQLRLLSTKIAAETESTQQLAAIARAELDRDQRSVRDQQLTTQSDLAEAEAALDLAMREWQRYQKLEQGAVSQLQIEEKQAAVRIAQERVARAKAVLNPSAAVLTIAQQRLAQVESTGRSTLVTLRQEQEVLLQQQAELRTQQAQTQQSLQQIQAEIDQTIVRATSDGVILRLNLRNPNQVVQAGETLAEISPNQDSLQIRAMVMPQDIGQVQLGQVAQMRITACPYPDYGLLKGEVVAISPDVVSVQATSSEAGDRNFSERSGFEVILRPEKLELTQGPRRCPLQSGMEAEATIITQEETFFRFLLRKARLLGGF